MRDFGYNERAKAVEDARSVLSRTDLSFNERRRAIARFRAALEGAYAGTLCEFANGNGTALDLDTTDILDFLEADPIFFGSGYMKERLLSALKKFQLSNHESERLREIMLNVVRKDYHGREFRHYCRMAFNLDSQEFRDKLLDIESSENNHAALRANWMLAALDGRFEEIARKSRNLGLFRPNAADDTISNAMIKRKNFG
jgi:hypothetical protein